MIVLHYTAMESAEAALTRLCDPEAEVSAHYLVDRDGTVFALVDEDKRAWHAGVGVWRGIDDINSASIGIELVNAGALRDFPPFPEPQMVALEALMRDMYSRWAVPLQNVVGHSETALGRKPDPGPKFDWLRFGQQDLALNWTGAKGKMAFEQALTHIGYGPAPSDIRLEAFRLRWRPHARGCPLEDADQELAAGLAEQLTREAEAVS